jgi:3-oxoacyl-[acyl-carrier protein] reductase
MVALLIIWRSVLYCPRMSNPPPATVDVSGLLDGRSVLVTGAGQGLGRAIASRCGSAGAGVVVNDINTESGAATAQLIVERGGRAIFCAGDISLERDVERVVSRAVEEFGALDLACNNAVPEVRLEPLDEFDVDYARHLISVALLGTAICLKHQLSAMRAGDGGSIVNISSTAHLRGQVSTGIYAGCKAGIEAMTRVAANEHGPKGIRVNAIRAGGMLTPALREVIGDSPAVRAQMEANVPLRRIAEPEDVADVALFLLSDLARNITGSVVTADGGGLLHTSSIPGRDDDE